VFEDTPGVCTTKVRESLSLMPLEIRLLTTFWLNGCLWGRKPQSGLLPSTLLSGQTSSSVWGALSPFGETVPPHDLALRHSPGQLLTIIWVNVFYPGHVHGNRGLNVVAFST
jgi:hypothetical protein